MARSSLIVFSWISACSKKDRTFVIKTLFYNILSTVPFKVVHFTGGTPFPTFLPLLECFLERTFCDGAQFSYRIFLNLRVFKKRPEFLNSARTCTEGALRLLSAPSGRFWRQTAICPVSLWTLFVELHPLNWTRSQAVRRINPTNSLYSCQNLPLGALSSRNAPSVLVGALLNKFGLFLNTGVWPRSNWFPYKPSFF
jgi:hypothetical protein